jgi:hypothetical protein
VYNAIHHFRLSRSTKFRVQYHSHKQSFFAYSISISSFISTIISTRSSHCQGCAQYRLDSVSNSLKVTCMSTSRISIMLLSGPPIKDRFEARGSDSRTDTLSGLISQRAVIPFRRWTIVGLSYFSQPTVDSRFDSLYKNQGKTTKKSQNHIKSQKKDSCLLSLVCYCLFLRKCIVVPSQTFIQLDKTLQ